MWSRESNLNLFNSACPNCVDNRTHSKGGFFFFKWVLGRLGGEGDFYCCAFVVHSTNNLETRVFSQGHTVGEGSPNSGI